PPGHACRSTLNTQLSAQQAFRDDELLDLRRSLTDRAELDVAVELLHREVLDETVAAMDLDGALGDPHGDLRREVLRLGGEAAMILTAVLGESGALGQEPRGVDRGRHLGEIELDRLELADRAAELPALLRVPERRLVGAAGDADR